MLQIYILSVVYLLIGSGILLVGRYTVRLLFFVDLRKSIQDSPFWQMVLLFSGVLIALALLFFPIEPGPRFLGDLLPALAVLGLVVYYAFALPGKTLSDMAGRMGGQEPQDAGRDSGSDGFDPAGAPGSLRRLLGIICLIVAAIHTVLPSVVIL